MVGSWISKIVIPDDRIRQVFDEEHIEELAESIYRVGLLHAPVVHKGDMTLVSGETRLKAIGELFSCGLTFTYNGVVFSNGKIPIVFLEDMTADQRLEAEIDENLKRRDITWQERLAGLSRLHKLRQSQHGAYQKGIAGIRPTQPGWGLTDTAREVVGEDPAPHQITEVKEALELADYLDDPMVAVAKDETQARKIIKELQKEQRRAALAEQFDNTETDHVLIKANCYDMDKLSGFDCIIADPPYGRKMHQHKFDKGVGKHEYDDSDAAFNRVLEELPSLTIRWTKPNSHLYVFCDILRFQELFVEFEIAGWTCYRRPLIWSKGNVGTFGNSDYDPRHVYDAILYAYRGEKKVTAMYPDVISDVMYDPKALAHPAGKPPLLYMNLLRRSCYPGELVLDPYAGGGTIFHAAQKLKLHATGIEETDKYHDMCIEAIQDALAEEKK